ncbi:MAG: precorrin-6A reductase [Brotaphodocola sp.]
MKEILIFAGTTEGRALSERMASSGMKHIISVATDYGEMVLKKSPYAQVMCGRLTQKEMIQIMREKEIAAVVDATHPYAGVVTENIKKAAEICQVPYLRLRREMTEIQDESIRRFPSHESCCEALKICAGNILLTTGSKDLAVYCRDENLKKRLYVRVLPGLESLQLCLEQGICGKQILALQGPFSAELNEALIRQYQIGCLVTKESGATGGYPEKIEAARKTKIPVFVIGHHQETGFSFDEICRRLESLTGKTMKSRMKYQITLAGIGMGNLSCQTMEVAEAIHHADLLLGAQRMICDFSARIEKKPYYLANQIISYLTEMQNRVVSQEVIRVVILFSGDSGFYSGCHSVYQALSQEIQNGNLDAEIRILPGISSVSYLSSCIGESYQDAEILSIHGRHLPNLAKKIATSRKCFLLMSGTKDLKKLGNLMVRSGLSNCEIVAGFHLSYPNQKIMTLKPEDCGMVNEEGLLTCMIRNPDACCRRVSHGISDTEFLREKVPMTKEEVREISICKLHLCTDSVVYDVGSGTGSIAVEMAGLSDEIQVYAIERKEEAAELIRKNQEKFGLHNITVIEAEAPEGLESLPVPTHAFIGGSGRKMKEILNVLYQKNPCMRVVINAITMESICEIRELLDAYPVEKEQVVQVQVSRARTVGGYHLMQAENPVWICAFDFVPKELCRSEEEK